MELTEKISRILNVFENDSGSPETDYKSVYIYHDGNGKRRQVTLARGFTDDGGSLKKVVERYISKGGQISVFFNGLLSDFGRGTLVDDEVFIAALKAAGNEQVMHDAQDEIYKEVYLQPALDWASSHGFVLNLSVAVIADSYLHSGRMPGWLMSRFAEKKPVDGGREPEWIQQYLITRRAWLKGSGELLAKTTYRPTFFINMLDAGNWELRCPIICRGAQIC